MTDHGRDPVAAAIDAASSDLPAKERREFERQMRKGLADIDPSVGPEDRAIEIDEVRRIPAAERVAWARRFAAQRRVVALQRRSYDVLRGFRDGENVESAAKKLLADVERFLDGDLDEDLRRDAGEVALECRYVLSGGKGPASLRTPKIS